MRSARINFRDKKIRMIGGGKQALLRGKQMAEEGASVSFVAPLYIEALETFIAEHNYVNITDSYNQTHIQDAFLVYACTDNKEINHQIVLDANAKGALSASVHRDEEATYHPLQFVDYPHMHAAVSTNGAFPAYNQEILEALGRTYEEVHHPKLEKLRQARAEKQDGCRGKKAVLVISYGTTVDETREKNIKAIESEVQARVEQWNLHAQEEDKWQVYCAFSSKGICKKLDNRGIHIMSLGEALETMYREGVDTLAVVPTHLLYGEVYQKMVTKIGRAGFLDLRITRPLLVNLEEGKKVLQCIHKEVGSHLIEEEEALVLMGHGTDLYGNMTYAALNYATEELNYDYMFIGCMKGTPSIANVIDQVKKAGYKKVLLMPFMVVAGKHALKDMAGEQVGSWLHTLQEAGLEVRVELQGLGELQGVRDLYLAQLETARLG